MWSLQCCACCAFFLFFLVVFLRHWLAFVLVHVACCLMLFCSEVVKLWIHVSVHYDVSLQYLCFVQEYFHAIIYCVLLWDWFFFVAFLLLRFFVKKSDLCVFVIISNIVCSILVLIFCILLCLIVAVHLCLSNVAITCAYWFSDIKNSSFVVSFCHFLYFAAANDGWWTMHMQEVGLLGGGLVNFGDCIQFVEGIYSSAQFIISVPLYLPVYHCTIVFASQLFLWLHQGQTSGSCSSIFQSQQPKTRKLSLLTFVALMSSSSLPGVG